MKICHHKNAYIKIYKLLIRKLMYLSYKIRFDITFIIKQISKCNINFNIIYFKVTKLVM